MLTEEQGMEKPHGRRHEKKNSRRQRRSIDALKLALNS